MSTKSTSRTGIATEEPPHACLISTTNQHWKIASGAQWAYSRAFPSTITKNWPPIFLYSQILKHYKAWIWRLHNLTSAFKGKSDPVPWIDLFFKDNLGTLEVIIQWTKKGFCYCWLVSRALVILVLKGPTKGFICASEDENKVHALNGQMIPSRGFRCSKPSTSVVIFLHNPDFISGEFQIFFAKAFYTQGTSFGPVESSDLISAEWFISAKTMEWNPH